jgi:hypothetical protein
VSTCLYVAVGDPEYMQEILKTESLLQSMKPACAGMRRLSRMALGEQPKMLTYSRLEVRMVVVLSLP